MFIMGNLIPLRSRGDHSIFLRRTHGVSNMSIAITILRRIVRGSRRNGGEKEDQRWSLVVVGMEDEGARCLGVKLQNLAIERASNNPMAGFTKYIATGFNTHPNQYLKTYCNPNTNLYPKL